MGHTVSNLWTFTHAAPSPWIALNSAACHFHPIPLLLVIADPILVPPSLEIPCLLTPSLGKELSRPLCCLLLMTWRVIAWRLSKGSCRPWGIWRQKLCHFGDLLNAQSLAQGLAQRSCSANIQWKNKPTCFFAEERRMWSEPGQATWAVHYNLGFQIPSWWTVPEYSTRQLLGLCQGKVLSPKVAERVKSGFSSTLLSRCLYDFAVPCIYRAVREICIS